MKPNISVIVPCHNSEKTIQRCINSLVNQTTTEPYELIFIDDGSTDKTVKILKNNLNINRCSIKIKTISNQGAWKARKTGIELAKGNYITFLDSDDIAKPIMLESLYNKILQTNSDVCVGGFNRVSSKDQSILSKEFCKKKKELNIKDDPGSLLEINPAPWNKLFKAAYIKNICDISPSPIMFDDLCLLILVVANGANKICFEPKAVVDYYVNPNSLINSVTLSNVKNGRKAIKCAIEKAIKINPKDDFKEAMEALAFEHLLISMSVRLSQNKTVEIKGSVKQIDQWLTEDYPKWTKSRYLKFLYCAGKNNSIKRLWIAYTAYRLNLLNILLKCYQLITIRLNFDIKW